MYLFIPKARAFGAAYIIALPAVESAIVDYREFRPPQPLGVIIGRTQPPLQQDWTVF